MVQGIKALRKIQLGREATAGTAVAASTVWRGMGALKDDLTQVFVEEDVGLLAPTDRSYISALGGSISLASTPATFEQLPHILEMGVGTATPTQDGAGSDYLYTYTSPTTTLPTLKHYTIEAGDNNAAEEMEYCFVPNFTLEGTAGEAVMMSADVMGRQVAASTFTGALSLPAVEEVLTNKGKFYIDAIGGTIGSTQITQTLKAFSLAWNTGLQAVMTADGNLYFTFVKATRSEITMDITFEYNANATTEIAKWRAGTSSLIRLQFEGSTVATPGTTYSNKTLNIDLTGKWDNFQAISDTDGNDIVIATFKAAYNATPASYAEILVVNELSTLP